MPAAVNEGIMDREGKINQSINRTSNKDTHNRSDERREEERERGRRKCIDFHLVKQIFVRRALSLQRRDEGTYKNCTREIVTMSAKRESWFISLSLLRIREVCHESTLTVVGYNK